MAKEHVDLNIKVSSNMDELRAMIEADELADKAEALKKMTPVEYARMRGIAPQLVYYYIRSGRLEKEQCICGRGVIDVESADQVLQAKKEEA